VEFLQQFQCEWMIGSAKANGLLPGRDVVGDYRGFGDNQREWARPELQGETMGSQRPIGGKFFGGLKVGNVHDERISRRPPFGPEDFFNRGWISGISAQAINCFSRKRDQPAALEDLDSFGDVVAHVS